MTVQINYKTNSQKKASSNLVLFVDEKFNLSRLKKYISNSEFSYISDLLKNSDLMTDNDGYVIKVIAASEKLSSIYSKDYLQLLKASYHLGNRHVELQINKGSLHYKHDHVLDDMIKSLGFDVVIEFLPFQPENGAYHTHKEGKNHHEHK